MFYFNSYKTEMELVTTDGNKEIVKGRVVYLKLPQWVSILGSSLVMGLLILVSIITYSRLQAVLV